MLHKEQTAANRNICFDALKSAENGHRIEKKQENSTHAMGKKKAKRRHALKAVPQHFLPLTSPLI